MTTDKKITEAHKLSDAFGMLFTEEVDALIEIAHLLPENAVCVNFGAGTGTSALAILEQRPDLAATFTTIDISEGGPYGGLQNEKNAFANANLPVNHVLLLSSSVEAGHNWTEKLDYCFIDGDHSYKGCKSDIEAWLPHMKKGGIIAFHDYERDVWPDVKIAVDEAMNGNEVVVHAKTLIAFRIK